MNKVLRGLARAVSLLAAVAVAAVIILYPRLVAEDSASVPHGFLVVLLMGMSAAWERLCITWNWLKQKNIWRRM